MKSVRVKDTVRAVLDRLPDDCKLAEVIDELCRIEAIESEQRAPELTRAQREALNEAIAHHEAHPEEGLPWRDVLRRIERQR